MFCLIGCACAYEQAGLLWAAHSNLLAAASIALGDFVSDGRIELRALRAVQRLVWIEIQLGRVPQILTYVRFEQVLARHLQLTGKAKEQFAEQFEDQDRALAMLLLRSSLRQLASMDRLPKTVESLGLLASGATLLFALGHEDALPSEGYFSRKTSPTEISDLFERLATLPGSESLPSAPEIFDEPHTTLRSTLLGCQWSVRVETTEMDIRIGEAFLAFMETFFATSLGSDAIPHRQHIRIAISKKNALLRPNDEEFQIILDDPDFLARIEYPASYDPNTEMVDHKLRDFLRDSLGVLIPRVLYAPDFAKYFNRIAGVEEGFGRSLAFSDVFTSASDVVGTAPTFELSEWLDEKHHYPLRRRVAVHFRRGSNGEEAILNQPKYGVGEPPEELRNPGRLKHSERRVLSVIETDLWDAANWRGVAVGSSPGHPPFMALLFDNKEAAHRIFLNWQERVGREDAEEIIRVSIVTGMDREHPSSYVTTISSNIERMLKNETGLIQAVVIVRGKRMDNPDPKNLEMLLSAYRTFGCYFLAPAVLDSDTKPPQVLTDLAILKRELIVRRAWEIGDNDPDMIAIGPDDDPIIPEGMTDPPVARTLQRHRNPTRHPRSTASI